MLEELLNSPDKFIAWLQSKEATAIVGISRSENACPLSNFVAYNYGTFTEPDTCPEWVKVFDIDHTLLEYVNLIGNKFWARGFVRAIDNCTGKVTAQECLEILK